ncbi:MAG: GNAT family N-acetyltransferase, partial [Rhizomicrobium sp.]
MPHLLDPGADDIAVLAQIHAASFKDGWSAKSIADLLAQPGVFAFLAPQGFILARVAGGEAEILTLAVAAGARRHGTGSALVRGAAGQARVLGATSLFLEVASDNVAALGLYRSLGFGAVGWRKAYHGDQDASVLKAAL